jgi:hypothetical protein
MIAKFSALVGFIFFIVFTVSIAISIFRSPIISFISSIPVVVLIFVTILMIIYDFKKILFFKKKK